MQVCAPSNSALDEIVLRLITTGLTDQEGRMFTPNVVRVGVNIHHSVQSVALDTLVDHRLGRDSGSQVEFNFGGPRHGFPPQQGAFQCIVPLRPERTPGQARGTDLHEQLAGFCSNPFSRTQECLVIRRSIGVCSRKRGPLDSGGSVPSESFAGPKCALTLLPTSQVLFHPAVSSPLGG